MSNWQRFILHLLIVSVVGPALGAGVYTFARAHWGDADLLSRLVGSLIGGFLLLVFIGPITLGVGIMTYGLCWAVTQEGGPILRWVWGLFGGSCGAIYGLLWSVFFVHGQQVLLTASGAVIGLATGAILAIIWAR